VLDPHLDTRAGAGGQGQTDDPALDRDPRQQGGPREVIPSRTHACARPGYAEHPLQATRVGGRVNTSGTPSGRSCPASAPEHSRPCP
jgi:hypothetical protein